MQPWKDLLRLGEGLCCQVVECGCKCSGIDLVDWWRVICFAVCIGWVEDRKGLDAELFRRRGRRRCHKAACS